MPDMTEREERTRKRAHELWEEAGRPHGRDQEFWYQAELEVHPRPTQRPAPGPGPQEPTREERIPGRIEPPVQREDPAGPPVGSPGTPSHRR